MPSYFILNKPPGCITGRGDPQGRATVYDHVPAHFPALPHVGRLDYNTEGLLLFTDDGRLARALLDPGQHAQGGIEKVYQVKVRPRLAPDDHRIAGLEAPLALEGGELSRPARARWLKDRSRSSWVEIVLTEGRHRQVRRLCERAGLQIVKLRRVALGPLSLGDLALRWCRPLGPEELEACYAAALPGVPTPRLVTIDDSDEARAAREREVRREA
jgi:23S rRNA pseudouridine2605 synthase